MGGPSHGDVSIWLEKAPLGTDPMQQVLFPGLTTYSGHTPCCPELALSWQEAGPESGARGMAWTPQWEKGLNSEIPARQGPTPQAQRQGERGRQAGCSLFPELQVSDPVVVVADIKTPHRHLSDALWKTGMDWGSL